MDLGFRIGSQAAEFILTDCLKYPTIYLGVAPNSAKGIQKYLFQTRILNIVFYNAKSYPTEEVLSLQKL